MGCLKILTNQNNICPTIKQLIKCLRIHVSLKWHLKWLLKLRGVWKRFILSWCTHYGVNCRINTEGCVFRGERFACRRHDERVSRAGFALGDVLEVGMAAQCCVVRSACRQEVRRLISCHHLPGVGEDGGGEQAEGIDTWVTEQKAKVKKWGVNIVLVNNKCKLQYSIHS